MNTLNKEKYLTIGNKKVEVSYELDKWYRNTKDALRKRQHRRGECTCPYALWHKCTTDCTTCPFRTTTNISLDGIYSNEGEAYGDEYLFQETKADYISFEDTFANREECKEILKRVYELMPELIEVGNLRLLGYTNSKVAEMHWHKKIYLRFSHSENPQHYKGRVSWCKILILYTPPRLLGFYSSTTRV